MAGPARGRYVRFLQSRFAPIAAGVTSAIVIWWAWGWVTPPPIIADEAAYLLQAKIFAGGHWTAPGRPLPGFFDRYFRAIRDMNLSSRNAEALRRTTVSMDCQHPFICRLQITAPKLDIKQRCRQAGVSKFILDCGQAGRVTRQL